jgi:hypothetical protein
LRPRREKQSRAQKGQRAGDQSLGDHLPNIGNSPCLRYLRVNL